MAGAQVIGGLAESCQTLSRRPAPESNSPFSGHPASGSRAEIEKTQKVRYPQSSTRRLLFRSGEIGERSDIACFRYPGVP